MIISDRLIGRRVVLGTSWEVNAGIAPRYGTIVAFTQSSCVDDYGAVDVRVRIWIETDQGALEARDTAGIRFAGSAIAAELERAA